MFYNVALLFTAVSSLSFGSAPYRCELKARHDLMEPFAVETKIFNGDLPIEVNLHNFRMRFQTVIVEGKETLALLLGQGKTYSAVTLAPVEQKDVYLNLLKEDEFAVVHCLKE